MQNSQLHPKDLVRYLVQVAQLHVHLSIISSATSKFLSWVFYVAQHSDPYNIVGLMATLQFEQDLLVTQHNRGSPPISLPRLYEMKHRIFQC